MRYAAISLAVLFAVGCSTATTAPSNPKMADADGSKAACPKTDGVDDCCKKAAESQKTAAKITTIGSIATLADGTPVEIEGEITKVCQGKGCWVEVTDGQNAIIAKSFGDKVLFPKTCVGQKVHIVGAVKVVKAADQCGKHKHEEEEEGEDHKQVQPHECPKPAVCVSIQNARLIE